MRKEADEYLRLTYQGSRAKDETFNVTTKTDFDSAFGNINVIQQDIGRVILNLINNAFYAVSKRKGQHLNVYEPIVTVSTKRVGSPLGLPDEALAKLWAGGIGGRTEIRAKDNGNGIPQKVLDKIFQPFFTTKPTGQGTGLGLSMSYDIVKAHGGELKVDTREGEETIFTIHIPVV